MAVRLTGQHNSLLGDSWKVEIIDKSGGGSSGVFDFRGDGYDIQPVGDPKNPHKTFNPSQCSFTMKIVAGNSAHLSFIEDLKNSPENRFFIKAYQNGFLDFAGPVKMDAVSYQDVPTDFDFTVVASDGISGLAGIDYSDGEDAYTGRQTYVEHFTNLFSKLGVDDLYGSDDAFTIIVNWYADEMPNKGVDNPWEMANVDHELFITRGEDGSPDFMKCMDVAEILLKPWHACLRYGQGRYWIEQIGERTEPQFVGWTYSITGTLRQTQTWNLDSLVEQNKANWKNSKFSMRGRTYSFLPALREVYVNYTYDEEYTPYSKDIDWDNVSGDICGPQTSVANHPDNVILRVKGLIRMKTTIDPTELTANGFITHRYYFKMRVLILTTASPSPLYTYYEREIDRLQFYNLRVKEGNWGPEGDVKFIDIAGPAISLWNNGTNVYMPIVFETKEIDISTVETTIHQVCFEQDGQRDVNGDLLDPLNYDLEWSFENVEITVVDADANEGKAKSYTEKFKGKGNEDNTATHTVDTILGDKKSNKNSILVYDGTEFVTPTMWGVGSGGGTHDSIIKLLIDEILALRTTPLEIANMEITGAGYTVLTTGRYTWQGINYLFDIGVKNSQNNYLRGDFFGLSKAPPASVITSILVVKHIDTFATRQADGGKIDIPPLDNEGITGVGDIIQEGATITSLSIPAATYNYFRTGDVIEVRDPATGEKQKFTVSADVNKGDTSISVTSVVATASLGEESKVIFDWAYESGQTYNETKERYEFFSVDEGNVIAGATELTITAFTLPPAATPIENARKRVRPQRNGVKMRLVADVSAYTGDQPLRVFELDPSTNKILLHSTAPVDAWDEFDVYAFEIVKE